MPGLILRWTVSAGGYQAVVRDFALGSAVRQFVERWLCKVGGTIYGRLKQEWQRTRGNAPEPAFVVVERRRAGHTSRLRYGVHRGGLRSIVRQDTER